MKRLLLCLLALAMVFSLAACGGDTTETTDAPPETETEPADTTPTDPEPEATDDQEDADDGLNFTVTFEDTSDEAEEPAPEAAQLDLQGPNTVDGQLEYTLVHGYVTNDVVPPRITGVYTHYEAPAGSEYLVLVTDVTNQGQSAVRADELLSASVNVGGIDYAGFSIVEEDEGEGLGYSNITDVAPLQTMRLYFLFEIPEGSDTTKLSATFTAGTDVRAATFSLEEFASRVGTLTVGQEITDGETLSLTVTDIYFSNTLYPPMPGSWYSYYEAGAGNTYLILKATATNLKGTDLRYSGVAGVTCEYDGKYQYTGFACFEEDGGADLNGYPSQYSISPLNSGTLYYLIEVPAQVESGPVEISLYTMGQYYTTTIGG